MEEKDGLNKREQQRDTRQHPVVTESKGGYGTHHPCVNEIPYRQIGKAKAVQESFQFCTATHCFGNVLCEELN